MFSADDGMFLLKRRGNKAWACSDGMLDTALLPSGAWSQTSGTIVRSAASTTNSTTECPLAGTRARSHHIPQASRSVVEWRWLRVTVLCERLWKYSLAKVNYYYRQIYLISLNEYAVSNNSRAIVEFLGTSVDIARVYTISIKIFSLISIVLCAMLCDGCTH